MNKKNKALKRGSSSWIENEEKRKKRIDNYRKLKDWSNDEQIKKMLKLYTDVEKRIQDSKET